MSVKIPTSIACVVYERLGVRYNILIFDSIYTQRKITHMLTLTQSLSLSLLHTHSYICVCVWLQKGSSMKLWSWVNFIFADCMLIIIIIIVVDFFFSLAVILKREKEKNKLTRLDIVQMLFLLIYFERWSFRNKITMNWSRLEFSFSFVPINIF